MTKPEIRQEKDLISNKQRLRRLERALNSTASYYYDCILQLLEQNEITDREMIVLEGALRDSLHQLLKNHVYTLTDHLCRD
jgi:transcriptional regulator CtsR